MAWVVVAIVSGVLALAAGAFFLFSWLLMLAWNAFLTPVFHIVSIDFQQAMLGAFLLFVVGNLLSGFSLFKIRIHKEG